MKRMNMKFYQWQAMTAVMLLLAGIAAADTPIAQATALAAEQKIVEAVAVLAAQIAQPGITVAERREAAHHIANLIHRNDNASYAPIRQAMEAFLQSDGIEDRDRLLALDTIAATHARVREAREEIETNKRLLALELGVEKRIAVLFGIGYTYIHTLRERDVGARYMLEALELKQKLPEEQLSLIERAARRVEIASIYRTHLQMYDEGSVWLQQALALYQEALPQLSGKEKCSTIVKLGDIYGMLHQGTESQRMYLLAVAEYREILAAAASLHDDEWFKAVEPETAIQVLTRTSEGSVLALEVAAKAVAAKGQMAEWARNPIFNKVQNICLKGVPYELLGQTTSWIEKQIAATSNPAERMVHKLNLGEAYYRIDKNLAKARQTFAEVAAAPEASTATRNEAQLWCEMLAD